jgi:hypothetical protein
MPVTGAGACRMLSLGWLIMLAMFAALSAITTGIWLVVGET